MNIEAAAAAAAAAEVAETASLTGGGKENTFEKRNQTRLMNERREIILESIAAARPLHYTTAISLLA